MRGLTLAVLLSAALVAPGVASAGAQVEEQISTSVRAGLALAVSDQAAPEGSFLSVGAKDAWLNAQSPRLAEWVPNQAEREKLLLTVHYEAVRAGLDPEMVLGLLYVESRFRKYAVSSAGARGYMQVMPFWNKVVDRPGDNLFHLRTNLRYGCSILRHYLDAENGDVFMALGRYNGSRGQREYPDLVLKAWKRYQLPARPSPVTQYASAE
ncbi:lytic transglycosylase domain-containing protein [Pseudomonas eucalypticola]|uniref:Lytic transglycosylase domain-containing protein n=1 Tax=Pseudomonas eucalypticola TaxID=2599595 RepID=A0A7D5DAH3_9PSED|nr:lytic transglycosylase domain-containing protein [Pseudomonas eucalypticola]QKZ07834.1 lytic transglycosylase domain-containing protein [Pseudomonas eucalypticola]